MMHYSFLGWLRGQEASDEKGRRNRLMDTSHKIPEAVVQVKESSLERFKIDRPSLGWRDRAYD